MSPALLEELRRLEVELHSLETRRDRARMEALLHPEFVEIGRSGKRYLREAVLSEFPGKTPLPAIQSEHYELTDLAQDVALLTYVSAHVGADGNLHRRTLRASVWVRTDSAWRLRFHQGTPAPDPAPAVTVALHERPSSRWLVLDAQQRVLLFRFDHKRGPLAGTLFWATPGGALEQGETFEEAARRELFEETGLEVEDVGPQVGRRIATLQLPTGEAVTADERFFAIRLGALRVSGEHWTELEREVMTDHRWWSQGELRSATDQVWPEDLADLLIKAGIWGAD